MRFRIVGFLALIASGAPLFADEAPRPLVKDFIGLCVHTVQFKPELYAPVTKVVRDYHPLTWDVGDHLDLSAASFPFAKNGVDWGSMYGGWKKSGYRIDACLQFDDVDPKRWSDLKDGPSSYGKAFATYFGPGHSALVQSVEIGNEPGKYDDTTYRAIFESMARGIRDGDRGMRIATCAVNLGTSGSYSKSVDCLTGLSSLYDVITVHIYPELEPWPTWRRSYPEDPKLPFLGDIGHVLEWRAQHAPGKEVWLTEFGWDASTQKPQPTGDFARWEGSTETQQAEWIVRAYLLLSATALDRAYLYFFNDTDEPHLHGSSGLTRNFKPKPAFHAVAHLQKTLGDYRFSKVIRADAEEGYLVEFRKGSAPEKRIWVVWHPTGAPRPVTLPLAGGAVEHAEITPLIAGDPATIDCKAGANGEWSVEAGEAPVYLWLK